MRFPSYETSISPTLVVWSLLIGSGSTSVCASAVGDERRQMTARSWSARWSVKKHWPPRTRGTLIRSERMRLERRVRIAGSDGRCASSDCVYWFWASIQARVSGLCWSSSQRYGSTISTPCRVSRTLSVRVGGGAATFWASAPAACSATAVASVRMSGQGRFRAVLIERASSLHGSDRVNSFWGYAANHAGFGRRHHGGFMYGQARTRRIAFPHGRAVVDSVPPTQASTWRDPRSGRGDGAAGCGAERRHAGVLDRAVRAHEGVRHVGTDRGIARG